MSLLPCVIVFAALSAPNPQPLPDDATTTSNWEEEAWDADEAQISNDPALSQTQNTTPNTRRESYRGSLALAHLGGFAASALLLSKGQEMGLLTIGLVPGMVHYANGNKGRAVGSTLGVPLAMLAGAGAGASTAGGGDGVISNGASVVGAFYGAIVGYGVAAAVDIVFAYNDVEVPFAPTVTPTQGGVMGGLSMQF